MAFEKLILQGHIQKHKTSKEEIENLLTLIERDIKDAAIVALSEDRRFTIAYNAVLQCGTIIMSCIGFRTKGEAHHFFTFEFLQEALGSAHNETIDYFNACRAKRNRTDYDSAGEISETEVFELIKEAKNFYKFTKDWVNKNFPQYL
ncbi:MAG: hypothetical protein FD145_1194 [Candidatus Saganbacteria bacterium]|uniref:SAV-6107-like HEPN domain-containing protein n=1 Tax=Candidatus Saganbacteria bacterium TaxID=2575572 RepID=A0A833L0H4_UNCSA|nr:MAG: hypothetical protein FD145_1194 [Candidatus Saganbacteria bacterium]